MPKPRLVYWDSCVFIDSLQQTPEWLPVLSAIMRAAQSGDAVIVTSALTLAEVVTAGVGSDQHEHIIRGLFENQYIAVRDLDRPTATRARQIVRDHRLKPQDAIHVATALGAQVSCLHTRDGSDRKRGLLDLDGKVGSPPLAITVPTWSVQPRLLVAPDDTSAGG
jgi:predicted nucleic acid-binding protein